MNSKAIILSVFLVCLATLVQPEKAKKDTPADRAGKFLVGVFTTRTFISITTVGSTVFATCAVTIATGNCGRKRRRRSLVHTKLSPNEDNGEEINASLKLSEEAESRSSDKNNRTGRLLRVTFWSTATSYLTIYSTSVDTAVSFRVSFYCSVVGANFPTLCG